MQFTSVHSVDVAKPALALPADPSAPPHAEDRKQPVDIPRSPEIRLRLLAISRKYLYALTSQNPLKVKGCQSFPDCNATKAGSLLSSFGSQTN